MREHRSKRETGRQTLRSGEAEPAGAVGGRQPRALRQGQHSRGTTGVKLLKTPQMELPQTRSPTTGVCEPLVPLQRHSQQPRHPVSSDEQMDTGNVPW